MNKKGLGYFKPLYYFSRMAKKKSPRKKRKQDRFIHRFSKSIKGWFLTNLKTKIGVLIFAILLWFFTMLGNGYTYTFEVPIEIINIEEGKTFKNEIPEKIQASFTGRGIDLLYLSLSTISSFKFVIDIQKNSLYQDYQLDEYFIENPEKIILPRNVEVQFNQIIWPEVLHIELDKFLEKKVPIVTDLNIEEASGYIIVGSPKIIPDSITISGAKTYVEKCEKIKTEKFTATNISEPLKVPLDLIIPKDKKINISDKSVLLMVDIEQIGERTVYNIPVKVKNITEGITVEVSPSTISLNIVASVSILKSIKPEDIEVYIDFRKDWEQGKSAYVPEVVLPKGVLSWDNMTPRKVEIRVIRERVS